MAEIFSRSIHSFTQFTLVLAKEFRASPNSYCPRLIRSLMRIQTGRSSAREEEGAREREQRWSFLARPEQSFERTLVQHQEAGGDAASIETDDYPSVGGEVMTV